MFLVHQFGEKNILTLIIEVSIQKINLIFLIFCNCEIKTIFNYITSVASSKMKTVLDCTMV